MFHTLSITEKQRQVMHAALAQHASTLQYTVAGSPEMRRMLDNDSRIADQMAKKLNRLVQSQP